DVTIDTHAVTAGVFIPLSSEGREVKHAMGGGVAGDGVIPASAVLGVSGTYGIYTDAYREAAAARGLLPREMQSITWEAAIGLFGGRKTPAHIDLARSAFLAYKNGDLSVDEVRQRIFQHQRGWR